MFPGANKSSSAPHPDHQPKLLDRHVREMVNTITQRVSSIPTSGGSHSAAATTTTATDDDELQQHGVSVITLAGTNTGATMRGEIDRDSLQPSKRGVVGRRSNKSSDMEDEEEEEEDANVGTYVNSNFQAVNNSIMLDSKYSTNDPGVHLEISDHRREGKLDTRGRKNNVVDDHGPSKSRGLRQRPMHHSEHDASTSE